MTEHDKTPKMARNDNIAGREFGNVNTPSQTEEASERHGLADDTMPDRMNRQGPGDRESGVMNRRGSGSQQSRPPGKKKEQHRIKRAA